MMKYSVPESFESYVKGIVQLVTMYNAAVPSEQHIGFTYDPAESAVTSGESRLSKDLEEILRNSIEESKALREELKSARKR
ncbi:MAG: hypothetical protein P4N59_25330 [Negativicutes bacterium]|nr:hypothetical protein [Negativicutes bacterium]